MFIIRVVIMGVKLDCALGLPSLEAQLVFAFAAY
jgi:hypothetical protein